MASNVFVKSHRIFCNFPSCAVRENCSRIISISRKHLSKKERVCFLKEQHRCASTAQKALKVEESESSGTDAVEKSAKLVTKPPFVKNLFLGKFDTDVLAYPQLYRQEELDTLNQMVEPVEKFFSNVDSKLIDENAEIPTEILKTVAELGLFGQQIPELYGGLGLNATKYARLAEVTALDGAIAVTLAAHQAIGLKGIPIAGTEAQKEKYLPELATGENIAAFCLTEPGSGSDAASIVTKATLNEDGTHYLLNGTKIWISNGGIADIFTVFARTEVVNKLGETEDNITAFIVERAFGGVTNGKPEDKLGIRGSNTCEVNFENTPVPVENVLGNVGEGFKLAMNILNSGRFSMGSSGAGVMKKLIGLTLEHALSRKQFGRKLMEFEMIQEKFGKLAVQTYAMESMAYLTAGMMDAGDRPDCALEAALVKIFSSEACWWGVSECLQILGGLGYMRNFPFERYLRDSRIMLIFEGTNEILRLFVALTGLQHTGTELLEMVKKLRKPFMNPWFTVKMSMKRRRQMVDNIKLNLYLNGYLHPSLKMSSDMLEWSVLRLEFLVQVILHKHGKNVYEKQMELRRIADIVVDIFAMTAVLGRASRSICIGLKNCDHEALIARTFCCEAHRRVQLNSTDLMRGEIVTNDESIRQIARDIVKEGGYAAVHPLTRNW